MSAFFKRLSALLCLAGLVLATGPVGAKTIRIATDVPYKPMEFADANGQLKGFDIALGNALCAEAGLDCCWVVQAWDGIVPGLMARKYDVIMSSMAITPARQQVLRFVGPYISIGSQWFVPKASELRAVVPDTMQDKRIGVQRGTIQDRYVTDHFAAVARIKRYQTAQDMTVDMAAHRLDAMLLTRIVGEDMLGSDITAYREPPVQPDIAQDLGIAFRPDEAALAARFDTALAHLKANGRYAALRAQWFGMKANKP